MAVPISLSRCPALQASTTKAADTSAAHDRRPITTPSVFLQRRQTVDLVRTVGVHAVVLDEQAMCSVFPCVGAALKTNIRNHMFEDDAREGSSILRLCHRICTPAP